MEGKQNGTGQREEAFWGWFQQNSGHLQALARAPDENGMKLYRELIKRIERTAPGVYPELTVDGDACVLVLSVGGMKSAIPALDRLAAAYRPTPGWNIQRFRKPLEGFTTEIEGLAVDPTAIRVGHQRDPAAALVHIMLALPGYKDADSRYKAAGFLALDHTLGEYNTMMHIGNVDFADLGHMRRDAPLITLVELRELIEREFY